MARTALFVIGLAAAASLSAPPSARAQCRLCDKPTTMPAAEGAEGPIDLQIEAGLDFDRLVVVGPGDGTAILRPDGTRQASGSVEAISGRAMVGQASVRGEPGRLVRVELPERIETAVFRLVEYALDSTEGRPVDASIDEAADGLRIGISLQRPAPEVLLALRTRAESLGGVTEVLPADRRAMTHLRVTVPM